MTGLLITAVTIAIIVAIVYFLGKPEKAQPAEVHTPRYAIRTANAIVFETDDAEQARRAQLWFRGEIIDREAR